MKLRGKRVLRLRPGHLANFSGGSAYMPFVTIFSVPGSLVCAVLSFFLLRSAARKLRQPGSPEDTRTPRTDLIGFVNHAMVHLVVSLIITLLAFFFLYPLAISWIYDMAPGLETAAFFLSVGPFLALLLFNIVVVLLSWEMGFRRRNLIIAAIIYVVVLALTILPEGGYMALPYVGYAIFESLFRGGQ